MTAIIPKIWSLTMRIHRSTCHNNPKKTSITPIPKSKKGKKSASKNCRSELTEPIGSLIYKMGRKVRAYDGFSNNAYGCPFEYLLFIMTCGCSVKFLISYRIIQIFIFVICSCLFIRARLREYNARYEVQVSPQSPTIHSQSQSFHKS